MAGLLLGSWLHLSLGHNNVMSPGKMRTRRYRPPLSAMVAAA